MPAPRLIAISSPNTPLADVVFFHGLEGDAQTTWRRADSPHLYFPKLVADANPNVAVWTVDYPIHVLRSGEATLPLGECGRAVLAELNESGLGDRPIITVGHSYGGLLIQQIIRHAEGTGHRIAKAIKGIALFGTPHSGSPAANWIRRLSSEFFRLLFSSAIEELTTDSPTLAELKGWMDRWMDGADVEVVLFSERSGIVTITSRESARGSFAEEEEIPGYGNHKEICKPEHADDITVRRVNRLVRECSVREKPSLKNSAARRPQSSEKGKRYRILAFLSGELPYTIAVSAALKLRLQELGEQQNTEYFYDTVEGPSDPQSTRIKDTWRRLIKRGIKKFGPYDCLVTIGTHASEMLKDFLGDTYGSAPFIFLAVSDPVKAGLVWQMNNRTDNRKVAGIAYWNDASEIVNRVANILPNRKLVFAYQDGFAADRYSAGRIENTNHGLSVTVRKLQRLPTLRDLRDTNAVYFSGYTFERFFQKYADHAKAQVLFERRIVVTNSYDYVQQAHGAVAAVGCDHDSIGEQGAQLIADHLTGELNLGSVPIVAPPIKHWINSDTARDKGIAFSGWGEEAAQCDFGRLEEVSAVG